MADVQADFVLLSNLNSLKVADLKKALKERGVPMPNSAKKPDLIAKLTEILSSSTSKDADPSVDDDFEQQLEAITEGKTSVSLAPAANDSSSKEQPKITDLIKPSNAFVTVTGSSLPRTVTTNTSTTSQANGATPGKVATSSSESPLSSSKSSNEPNIKKVTAASTSVHPLDKLAARAARFGSLEEDKTNATSKPAIKVSSSAELEALKKRSDRFGVSVSSSLKTLEANEKLALRASRFGVAGNSSASSGVKRLSSEEDEKLKKRRERFGL